MLNVHVLCLCVVCVPNACVMLVEVRRGRQTLKTGVTNSYELPCGCWLNLEAPKWIASALPLSHLTFPSFPLWTQYLIARAGLTVTTVRDDLELLIVLPLFPEWWDYRNVPLRPVHVVNVRQALNNISSLQLFYSWSLNHTLFLPVQALPAVLYKTLNLILRFEI